MALILLYGASSTKLPPEIAYLKVAPISLVACLVYSFSLSFASFFSVSKYTNAAALLHV